ncbi:MAG: hypothetical protein KAI35_05110, partial [Desulfobulbaceae bacterium]|nr:hypothetical protein [Desulfobulbaceae bacterium]
MTFNKYAQKAPEDLGERVVKQPSMMTGAIPKIQDWRDLPPVKFQTGNYAFPPMPDRLEYIGLPNPRIWSAKDEDWKLPDNWKEIILEGMRVRLDKFRSFKVFMDCCVR